MAGISTDSSAVLVEDGQLLGHDPRSAADLLAERASPINAGEITRVAVVA